MVSSATFDVPCTGDKWVTLSRGTCAEAKYPGMAGGAIEGGKPGEAVTFEHFVREQRRALLGFLRRRLFTEEDVQDIAQESLTRLIRYREHPPETWHALLYRIATNAVNDSARRAHAHHTNDHVSLDENAQVLASTDPAHEHRIDTHQELARVQRALLRLPERCRDMYLLNRIEGMSYPEIARHCGVSIKAVEKQIGKALSLLRTYLGKDAAGIADRA